MVHRYKLTKSPLAAAMLVWRYQPGSLVTSMAQLGATMVVLGTNIGQLNLLDWTSYSTERSFSNEKRPRILRRFVPHDRLVAPREDLLLGKRMGIIQLRVDALGTPSEAKESHWGRFRLTWVTQCGWLLSLDAESPKMYGSCHVIHATEKALHRNADGLIVKTERQSWSLPQTSVAAYLSSSVVCVVNVPQVTKILSHHNKFVLDGQPTVAHSRKKSLVVWTEVGKQTVPLPKTLKHLPQGVIVHPNHEWIVVAEGTQLHILSSRCNDG